MTGILHYLKKFMFAIYSVINFRDVKSKVHRENRWHNDIHTINNASRLIILYIKYIQFTTHAQFAFLGLPRDDESCIFVFFFFIGYAYPVKINKYKNKVKIKKHFFQVMLNISIYNQYKLIIVKKKTVF